MCREWLTVSPINGRVCGGTSAPIGDDYLAARSPFRTVTRPPLWYKSCVLRLCVQNSRTAPFGFRTPPPSRAPGPFPKTSSLGNAAMPRLGSSAPLRPLGCVPIDRAKKEKHHKSHENHRVAVRPSRSGFLVEVEIYGLVAELADAGDSKSPSFGSVSSSLTSATRPV